MGAQNYQLVHLEATTSSALASFISLAYALEAENDPTFVSTVGNEEMYWEQRMSEYFVDEPNFNFDYENFVIMNVAIEGICDEFHDPEGFDVEDWLEMN